MDSEAVLLHIQDLRIQDNPALRQAAQHNSLTPLYIWDGAYLDQYGAMYKEELKDGLRRLNKAYHDRGSYLVVRKGSITDVVDIDAEIYMNDVVQPEPQHSMIDEVRNSHVNVVKAPRLEAASHEDSQQRINQYLDAKQVSPPSQLPNNPATKSIRPGTETPYEALDLTVFNHHADNYLNIVSNPVESRKKTTRSSELLATGQLSLRSVYQRISDKHSEHPVLNRLRWNLRFKQKLRNFPRMNTVALNPYLQENNPYETSQKRLERWKNGSTGHPLVDASMRCLNKTGYLNFRMRALVASYLTHVLHQPWWHGAEYMHAKLRDAEPAINHYQWQMQSHMIGTHPLRIYNPTKQARDHDPKSIFIESWVDELQTADNPLQPWEEQTEAYPDRITRYSPTASQTREWFKKRMQNIVRGVDEQNGLLLGKASQRRHQKQREKYLNKDLADFQSQQT